MRGKSGDLRRAGRQRRFVRARLRIIDLAVQKQATSGVLAWICPFISVRAAHAPGGRGASHPSAVGTALIDYLR